jgi:catechol 2,3-dioxygenase-like lactoylglutathione lyase family enzyme
MRLAGVELYFDDLEGARQFYRDILKLELIGEEKGHHTQFDAGGKFVCLERKGIENYSSRDKAVVFLEVDNLADSVAAIGAERFARIEDSWAVLHDPEGHNILLLQKRAA